MLLALFNCKKVVAYEMVPSSKAEVAKLCIRGKLALRTLATFYLQSEQQLVAVLFFEINFLNNYGVKLNK
eukprot:1123975-Amphidinium_carterae.1